MDLKELLGEELFTQVTAKIGDTKIAIISDGSYIPKAKFDDERKTLKDQITTLAGQVTELKKSAEGNEELTKKIQTLTDQNADWEKKYKKTAVDAAVQVKLAGTKAKDINDLMKFLDFTKIELTEAGEIKGVDEQITELKKSKTYLFEDTTNNGGGFNPPDAETQTKLAKLKEAHAAAVKLGDTASMMAIRNQIFALENQKQ